MHNWTVENYVTLISALVAAFTSIWNAVHGKAISNTLDAHEQAQQARHHETLNAVGNARRP